MAIVFNNKKGGKKIKVDHNHNYGGFWLDRSLTDIAYEGRTGASNVVKALKLRNYQRAIANFVKILSQRDVPVIFKGTDSYTDNNRVVIAGNISDKNFDVTAGLALHEASHLKYTDFNTLTELFKDKALTTTQQNRIKGMINWIEDRRIDSLVFKSCPGYKAYYHKLYDYYFRTKEMSLMLKNKRYRTEIYSNYEAHIFNMMNESYDPTALKLLPQITSMIDVNNISRLNDTSEVATLATTIVLAIEKHLVKTLFEQPTQEQEQQPGAGQEDTEEAEEQDGVQGQGGEEGEEGQGGQGGMGQGDAGQEDTEEAEEPQPELTASQINAIEEALRAQRDMIDGKDNRKQNLSQSMNRQIGNLQNSETDYVSVGGTAKGTDCLIYRLDKETNKVARLYATALAIQQDYKVGWSNEAKTLRRGLPAGLETLSLSKVNQQFIADGYQLGTILGKKLQTRRESRELVTNRLRTGKIDAKRVAHAGYGIENIFNQIHIDKYNKANIHLTIDASGSMGGSRWQNSLKMAMALGKAVSMIEGIDIQVSMRETTDNELPVVSIVYDSRINKLNHLKMILEMYNCQSMTPEGLCLEAMLKKKLILPTTADCDSYLINICDGSPGAGSYGGYEALNHTKNQVKRINTDLGVSHVGFFFGSADTQCFQKFTTMYGKAQSIAIPDASNATMIAKHMNTQLMAK